MSVITKAYLCIFVSFTVKAVHLEVVPELTTAAFIACCADSSLNEGNQR